jgi:hypothetical protein
VFLWVEHSAPYQLVDACEEVILACNLSHVVLRVCSKHQLKTAPPESHRISCNNTLMLRHVHYSLANLIDARQQVVPLPKVLLYRKKVTEIVNSAFSAAHSCCQQRQNTFYRFL